RWGPSRGRPCPDRAARCRSLANAEKARVAADLGDDRLAGDASLAEEDARTSSSGQIDVDPAAEADHPDPLPGFDTVAFMDERQDSPRDQPGDLGEADLHAVGALDQEMLALI